MKIKAFSYVLVAFLAVGTRFFVLPLVVSAEPEVELDPGATGNDPDLWTELDATEIDTVPGLLQMFSKASKGAALIFKHSTTCPISGAANERVTKFIEAQGASAPDFYMVRVIESRDLSIRIAERFEVTHESPQIILVKEGKAVWSTSHEDITAEEILKALKTHLPELSTK